MTFQHFPHINACGRKFDRGVKRSKVNLRPSFEQTFDFESLMLYTKIQPQSFLGSEEEDFLICLTYMGMAAIFLMVQNH